jgi:hypothetical protein
MTATRRSAWAVFLPWVLLLLSCSACRTAPPPEIEALVPPSTRVGVDFQVQPNGESAIAVQGKNFQEGATITANGQKLSTAYGGKQLVTAFFPKELYAKPGKVSVQVVNPDGSASQPVDFIIQ